MDTASTENSHVPTSRLDGIARIILRTVVFLLPLAVFPNSWLSLPMGKMGILAIGVLAALILWSVARFKEHRITFPQTNILWAALLLILGYAVAAVLSGNLMQSLVGFGFERDAVMTMFTFVAALFTVALTTEKVMHFIRLQQAALAAFFLLAAFQIARVVIGGDAVFPALFSSDATVTTLGSWNDLAVFSGLAIIMTLSGLALFTAKAVRGVLYLVLLIGLFLLSIVNLVVVWITLIMSALLLMVYIFADTSHDQASGMFTPKIPWKRFIPNIVVILVGLVFLIGGVSLGNSVSDTFNIAYVDVRPSWEGTIIVGSETLRENILFGSGPNTFKEAWITYKPQAVNGTNFWDTDFNFGVGLIPTAFITGGLVVGVLWMLFFASFLYLGFRMLIKRATQPAHMYMIISSFLGASYLWILTIVYVPQIVILAYTFILTGIVIAAARISGVLKSSEVNAKKSYATGIALTGILAIILIAAFVALLFNLERVRASVLISQAIAVANSGDLIRAAEIADGRLSLVPGDARAAQLRTNIGLATLSSILAEENEDTEDLRKRFETELTKTISAAQAVVAIDNSNYRSWLLLADVYASLVPLEIDGAYDSAVVAYGEAKVRNTRTPIIAMSLARLAFTQKDLGGARAYANEALAIKSNYTDAFYLLSQIAISENNVKEAISSTEAAAVLNPNNTGILFQLGLLQYSVGEYENVIPVLERAVTINPNYSNALYYLGLAYERLGNEEGTLIVFERIAALNPENTEIQAVVESLKEGGSAVDLLEGDSQKSKSIELPVSEKD